MGTEVENRYWSSLSSDEQLRLRLEYQPILDTEVRSCSMDVKTARFARWLKTRGVLFSMDDVKG